MQNTSTFAKKVISAVVTVAMIVSLFTCLSGLSVFAVDNTPAAKSAVTVAPVKATETKTAPKLEGEHSHCTCGQPIDNHQPIGDHVALTEDFMGKRTFNPLDQATVTADGGKMKGSGNWYLTEDITVSAQQSISGGLFICLNGHNIIITCPRMFILMPSFKVKNRMMSICDCVGTGRIIQDGSVQAGDSGLLLLMHTTFEEEGSDPTNGTAFPFQVWLWGGGCNFVGSQHYSGGLVSCCDTKVGDNLVSFYGNHKVKIYGGEWIGDTNDPVWVQNGESWTQTGGSRASWGGLIVAKGDMQVDIFGGTFQGSSTKHRGSVLYLENNAVGNISGGTFNGGFISNQVGSNAGGTCLYAGSNATLNISGSPEFTGALMAYNKDRPNKGGVILSYGALNITGTPVIKAFEGTNFYTGMGGAIYSGGTLNITGEPRVIGARASNGCAIAIDGCKDTNVIDLGDNGYIEGNNRNAYGVSGSTGSSSGGAISITGENTGLTIKGTGTIQGSRNVRDGGAIYVATNSEVLNIEGCTINGGDLYWSTDGLTTTQCRGATILSYGQLNISGGTINAGTMTAKNAEGANPANNIGMCIFQGSAKMRITGGVINGGNNADSRLVWGGALYCISKDAEISGNVKIYGNDTEGNCVVKGGAVFIGETGTTINLGEEGVIASNADSSKVSHGGAIYVARGKTLNITGAGTITGKARYGGSVYADSGAILNISGNVNIDGGESFGGGGNIYINRNGTYEGKDYPVATLNISGGTIQNGKNVAATGSSLGGNIFCQGNLNITGGVIKDGQSVSENGYGYAGNIYISNKDNPEATAEITGGQIIGGIADGTTAKTNSETGETTYTKTASGGSILLNNDTLLAIAGTAEISGGTVEGSNNGGTIYMSRNSHLVIGGEAVIIGGKAYRGGAVTVSEGCVADVNGGTVKDGVACMGGNFYVYKATLNLNGGTVKDGKTGTDNYADAARGGNIHGDTDAIINIHEGATVSGGYVGVYHNASGAVADSFGGGNIALGVRAVVNMDGGIVKDGGSVSRGGGNVCAMLEDSQFNMTGGVVENGYGPSSRTGNFYFIWRSRGNVLNISGGTVNKGEGEDDPANKKYYGGAWVGFYHYAENDDRVNTINITGDAVINDWFGCDEGSFIEIKDFTGTANCAVATERNLSQAWDKDYIENGQFGLLEDMTHTYSEGKAVLVNTKHDDNAAAVDALDTAGGNIHLADRDAVLAYNKYNDASKAIFEEKYGAPENLETMVTQANDYNTMMETKVAVKDKFGEDQDRVLYVIYSSVDEADIAEYDFAQIIITINGTTVGADAELDKITDVYKNVTCGGELIASEGFFEYEEGHTDKSDYVYYKTISLTAANAAKDVDFEFYSRIYLKDGTYVDGKHVKGKLSSLLPAQS